TSTNLACYCNGPATPGYCDWDGLKVVEVPATDTFIPSYEHDWGLDIGAVGAQLTKVGTFPCDEEGNSILLDSEIYSCVQMEQANRATCCANTELWNGEGMSNWEFYKECMNCGDGQPACSLTGDHGNTLECDPVTSCEEYWNVDDDGPYNTCTHGSNGYNRNTYLRQHVEPGFEVSKLTDTPYPFPYELDTYLSKEVRQELFKRQFRYYPATDGSEQPGYYAYWFTLNMQAIENGSLGQFGVLAPNNFNYRLRTVATNVVGTDVVNCSLAEAPETCAANPWVTYDLK
ncbi:MAG: hypothetical protein GY851_27965, partial [bacterium]|nr:hypothetical protein [bacterium]